MKHYVTVLVVLAALLAVHVAQERSHVRASKVPENEVFIELPEMIGGFRRVANQDPGDSLRRALLTSNILLQTYVSPTGIPVALSLVHAGSTRRSLHFPEVCLVGQGWEVRAQYTAPIGFAFTGKRLLLFRGDQNEAVLYWFKTGDKFTGSFFENSWHWALGHLGGGKPSSTMIRLSTATGPIGEEAAFAVLDEFAVQLAPVLLDRVE